MCRGRDVSVAQLIDVLQYLRFASVNDSLIPNSLTTYAFWPGRFWKLPLLKPDPPTYQLIREDKVYLPSPHIWSDRNLAFYFKQVLQSLFRLTMVPMSNPGQAVRSGTEENSGWEFPD